MSETAFADLEIACMVAIFSRLDPTDAGRAACVARLWNGVLADDAVWRPHLARDFAAASAVKPDGSPAASLRAAYAAWRTEYADVAGPLLARTLAAWGRMKAWLGQRAPRILASLNPGATRAQVEAAEQALGHSLPLALRCIYRVHNGQRLQLTQQACEEGPPPDLLLGLFGCLVFYDHISSNALRSLEEAVKMTLLLRSPRPMGARHPVLPGRHVLFAASFTVADKMCVLDCDTGGVYFKLPHMDWPLAPPGDSFPGACDGLLRWFEEYSHRLAGGWYDSCEGDAALAGTGLDLSNAISLFPRAHPLAATAVTRGVQVSWSSVLVPQECRNNRLLFAYSVRFQLLTAEQEAAAAQQLAAQEQAWQQQQEQQQQQQRQQEQQQEQQQQQQRQQEQQQQQQQGPPDAGGSGDAGAAGSAAAAAAAAASNEAGSCAPAAAAASAAAATTSPLPSSHAGGQWGRGMSNRRAAAHGQQTLVLGPCSASAGPACVPAALAAAPSPQATGGAATSNGSDAAAPAAISSGGGGGDAPAAPSSCQLESRHWCILDAAGSQVDSVDGEGVVGLYPLLYPGGEPFAYASCTPFAAPHGAAAAAAPAQPASARGAAPAAAAEARAEQQPAGTAAGPQRWPSGPGALAGSVLGAMQGTFTFVGGSLMQRAQGGAFSAACPRLVFAVPEFIY